MHKKHFTNSEKEALKVFNALSRLVESGIIVTESEFVKFDVFDEMLTGPILVDSISKQSRQITFIKKSGYGCPFIVKVTLWALRQRKRDRHARWITWKARYVDIGWLKRDELAEEWVVGAAWQFHWPCPGKEGIMKHDWRSSPASLKEFSKPL